MSHRFIHILLMSSAIALSAPASASIKWQMDSAGSVSCASFSTSCYGNTRTYSGDASGAPTVTASAWANTDGSSNTLLQNAYLGVWSGNGLGVRNRDACSSSPSCSGDYQEGVSPEHAMDNNQRIDSILFNFQSSIVLTGVKIGWSNTDSDISVLAYTGAGVPVLTGMTYSNLLSNNWQLVGNYANAATGNPAAINSGNISASYWLISAYNPGYGTGNNLSGDNDFVKLLYLAGARPQGNNVPEPATWLLFAAGLLGFVRYRKN